MTNLKEFRNEIIPYAFLMAALSEIISFFVIGLSLEFTLGLLAGTAVSIFGFAILVRSGEHLLNEKKKSPVVWGYVFRLLLYAVAFFICIKIDLKCGAGCGCGFISIYFGIMFLYGIVYTFIKKKKNPLNDWIEPKKWNDLSIYDDDDDWGATGKEQTESDDGGATGLEKTGNDN